MGLTSSSVCITEDDAALYEAVRRKRWDMVPVLLQHGAHVNMQDSEGYTVLHRAVRAKRWELVPVLLQHGAHVNMQDEDGDTVLHWAVEEKRWELVPVLLQHGADVNLCGYDSKQTPLHVAAWYGAPADIITQLIPPHNINMQDRDGNTALHWAVEEKRWELVPVLLQHGADVNVRNRLNQTPLHWAAYHGAPADIITRLISPHNINVQDKSGDTVLHWVVSEKRWELVPVLLQHGADVNMGDDHLEQTPLHDAVYHGAPADIITQLISPHNINMQDKDGDTALHGVVYGERWELVPVLLQHGADVNLCDHENETPLHLAAYHGAPADIITQLISPHNINVQDKDGDTVLHWVVGEMRWHLVPVLLKHGADVNLYGRNQTAIGRTLLNKAVREKRWELVPILLQNGADPSMLDASQPEEPLPRSLKALCIATIRSHMPVKSDEAYKGLGLPGELVDEAKLRPQAEDIVNGGQSE